MIASRDPATRPHLPYATPTKTCRARCLLLFNRQSRFSEAGAQAPGTKAPLLFDALTIQPERLLRFPFRNHSLYAFATMDLPDRAVPAIYGLLLLDSSIMHDLA